MLTIWTEILTIKMLRLTTFVQVTIEDVKPTQPVNIMKNGVLKSTIMTIGSDCESSLQVTERKEKKIIFRHYELSMVLSSPPSLLLPHLLLVSFESPNLILISSSSPNNLLLIYSPSPPKILLISTSSPLLPPSFLFLSFPSSPSHLHLLFFSSSSTNNKYELRQLRTNETT